MPGRLIRFARDDSISSLASCKTKMKKKKKIQTCKPPWFPFPRHSSQPRNSSLLGHFIKVERK